MDGAGSIGEKLQLKGVTFNTQKKLIEKNNPIVFFEAFQRMVEVMCHIKEKNDIQNGDIFDEKKKLIIKNLLETKEDNQAKVWVNFIKNRSKDLDLVANLSYDKKLWVNNHNSPQNTYNHKSEFIEFMEVAIEHQEFVEEFIKTKLEEDK